MPHPTLLIVKTHALGDLLLITPAVHRLRLTLPDWRIVLLTTAGCVPLLQGNDDIDGVVALPDLTVRSALMRLPAIRRRAPHMAVVFQASWAAHQLARAAGARTVYSLRGPCPIRWPPSFSRYTADAYGDLVECAVAAPPVADRRPRLAVDGAERAKAHSLTGAGAYAVVAAGGGQNPRQSVNAKRWAPARLAQLCDAIDTQTGLPVVLVGAETDAQAAYSVADHSRVPIRNLTGATDLRVLAAVVAEAAVVVTIDSVVLHMAVALDRPVVGLFGPTSCANFLPAGRHYQIGVSSRAPCSPCYGNSLFPGCRVGRPACMDTIGVDEVLTAVRSVLE